MGGLFSALAGIGEIISATGFTAEAIVSGEAAAAISAQLEEVIAIGGAVSAAEALETLGLDAGLYGLTLSVPEAFAQVSAGYTSLHALLAGTATLGPSLYFTPSPFSTNPMALQVWRPDPWIYPEARWLMDFVDYIDPLNWGQSLFQSVSAHFWNFLSQYGYRTIGNRLAEESSALAVRTGNRAWQMLADTVQQISWTVRNTYATLGEYYSYLPVTAGRHRLEPYQLLPDEEVYNIVDEEWSERVDPWRRPQSGVKVNKTGTPGGTNQICTPDWLLPLILGLYGDLTPSWKAEIKELEDGEKKSKRRKMSTPHSRPKINRKRRGRGLRRKNRA